MPPPTLDDVLSLTVESIRLTVPSLFQMPAPSSPFPPLRVRSLIVAWVPLETCKTRSPRSGSALPSSPPALTVVAEASVPSIVTSSVASRSPVADRFSFPPARVRAYSPAGSVMVSAPMALLAAMRAPLTEQSSTAGVQALPPTAGSSVLSTVNSAARVGAAVSRVNATAVSRANAKALGRPIETALLVRYPNTSRRLSVGEVASVLVALVGRLGAIGRVCALRWASCASSL